jgi:hypothetical protein
MTQEKMEIEKSARGTTAKLPKLKITPFKGTATDWLRFENIFLTQVHGKPITDEEKFGYLLEMVCPKVRDKIGITLVSVTRRIILVTLYLPDIRRQSKDKHFHQ